MQSVPNYLRKLIKVRGYIQGLKPRVLIIKKRCEGISLTPFFIVSCYCVNFELVKIQKIFNLVK